MMESPELKSHVLRAPASLYRATIGNSPGFALFVVDPTLRYLAAEGKALAAAGLSPSQFIGRTVAEAHDRTEVRNYERHYRRVLSGETFAWEQALSSRTFLFHGQPLRDPQGRIFAATTCCIDITEHCRSETALENSLESYRLLFDNAADGIWIAGRDGRFIDANPAACSLLGYSRNEYLTLRLEDLIRGDTDTARLRALKGALALGQRITDVWELRHADGSFRSVEISHALTADGQWQAIGRDIGERRHIEPQPATLSAISKELAGMRRLCELFNRLSSETALKPALETIIEAANSFLGADRGCIQLVSANGEHLEMYAYRGYTEDHPFIQHFLHKGSKPACDAARRDKSRLIIEDIATFEPLLGSEDREIGLASGIRATQSTPLITRDGEVVGVLSTQFREPHRPSDDALKFVDLLAWTAAEFVARNLTENARQLSEERLLQFSQAASVVLWTRNAETLQFEYLSPAFENIYGHSMAQIEPGDNLRNWLELIHPDDRAQVLAHIERVRQGERVSFEYRVTRPDGQIRWLRNSDFPIMDATGKVIKIGGIGEDITALKLAEDSLRVADRHKDEFLATLGHELRNPLAPLRNGLSLMRQIQGTDHRLTRVVDMMDRQLSQLVRLVDDLLDLGRINAGKIQLALAPVALAQVLFRSIESVQSLIEAKNHSLEVHEPPEPLVVEGDADRLTQIFANLLSNAGKYTERGGRITVTLSNEGGTAVVRVDDTGIGIPAADLPRVFDLFSQVRMHQTHAQGGLGIGLSLVHRLVALHGGSITAQSAGPGLGSTFTVRLPRLA